MSRMSVGIFTVSCQYILMIYKRKPRCRIPLKTPVRGWGLNPFIINTLLIESSVTKIGISREINTLAIINSISKMCHGKLWERQTVNRYASSPLTAIRLSFISIDRAIRLFFISIDRAELGECMRYDNSVKNSPATLFPFLQALNGQR